jgi:hypothetical protein
VLVCAVHCQPPMRVASSGLLVLLLTACGASDVMQDPARTDPDGGGPVEPDGGGATGTPDASDEPPPPEGDPAPFQNPGGGVIMYDDAEQLPLYEWGIDFRRGYAMATGGRQSPPDNDDRANVTVSTDHARRGWRSYRMHLEKRTDYPPCCEWVRSEWAWLTPDQQTLDNEWRWAAVSILVPDSFQFESRRMMIGFDHKEAPDDLQTPFGLNIQGDRYHIDGRFVDGPVDLGPVEKGVWVDWLLERNWKTDGTGFMRFYKNGQLVWERNGPNRDGRSGSAPICRIQHGIYKWVWATEGGQGEGTGEGGVDAPIDIYLDEIRFGDPSAELADFLLPR